MIIDYRTEVEELPLSWKDRFIINIKKSVEDIVGDEDPRSMHPFLKTLLQAVETAMAFTELIISCICVIALIIGAIYLVVTFKFFVFPCL